MTQKMQVLCGLQVLFLLFNCQTPENAGCCRSPVLSVQPNRTKDRAGTVEGLVLTKKRNSNKMGQRDKKKNGDEKE